MKLSEEEIRQIIRARIIAESQGTGVTAGDVGSAAAATTAGVTALGTGLTVMNVGGATNAALATAATVAQLSTGVSTANAIGLGFGAYGTSAASSAAFTTVASGGSLTGAGAAGAILGISNPIGWGVLATVAIGMAMGYIFMSKSDVGAEFVEILDGTLAKKTQEHFSNVEKVTKEKLIEMGMEKEARDFPSLQHYNNIRGLHTQLAKEFYAAETDNHSLFGMGTDEEEIGKIILKHPSLMDLSLTALAYKDLYGGKFNKYDSLIDMFEGELADEDSLFGYGNEMTDFVRGPIRKLENRAIICFNVGGGEKKCFSRSELEIFLKELDEGLKKAPDLIASGEGQIIPIDPNGLQGNITKRIQIIMNKYSELHLIGKKITPDGKWGPQTDSLWEKVLNHTFKSHTVLSKKEYAQMFKSGFYEWSEVSEKMVVDFPGYVSSQTGCLAFVTDAYNGDTAYGSGEKKISMISGGGRSGGSKTGKTIDQTGDEDFSGSMSTPEGLRPSISVMLAGQGKTSLESLGYANGTTSGLAEAIAARAKGNISGGTINLTVVVNRDGIVRSVRLAPGQRRSSVKKQFENLRNVVRRYLEKAGSADNSKIEPSRVRSKVRSKARKFELVLNFPAGRYN